MAAGVLLLLTAGPAGAAGWNDGTFGRGGRVRVPFSDQLGRVAVGPDDSVVLGRTRFDPTTQQLEGVVLKLTPEGGPDPSFGKHGTVVQVGITGQAVSSVAVSADGSIVVGGTQVRGSSLLPGRGHPVVTRYLADGTPDPSFGADGVNVIPTDGQADVEGLLLLPDGTMLVSLGLQHPGGAFFLPMPALARLLADGSLDSSFGVGGIAPVPELGPYPWVGVDRAGRILLGGTWDHVIGHGGLWMDWAVRRLQPDGAVDPTFGDNGVVEAVTTFDVGDHVRDLVALPNGGAYVLVGDDFRLPGSSDVLHLWPNGTLDRSFGRAGDARVHVGCVDVLASAIEPAPDGGIAAAGWGVQRGCGRSSAGLVVTELTASGQTDASFGNGGWARVDRFGGGDTGDLAIDGHGRPLVAVRDDADRGFQGLIRLRSPWA